ncbi:hypothetical protein [Nostoc sp. CMAA1605]|nr:hypothetical protein [Nostoc sp. CMAA1605]
MEIGNWELGQGGQGGQRGQGRIFYPMPYAPCPMPHSQNRYTSLN